MPNITWQEPQIFAELLTSNYNAVINDQEIPGSREIAFISPWISNVELICKPGVWNQSITVGQRDSQINLSKGIHHLCKQGWKVHVAVLQYGKSISGLYKDRSKFQHEVSFLKSIFKMGALIYMCPDLHAKGLVTPFGIITGGTNFTYSGLFLQSQNSNYFPHNHPDYESNRIQLISKFSDVSPASSEGNI